MNIAIAIIITAKPWGIETSVGFNIGSLTAFPNPNIIISSIVLNWPNPLFPSHFITNTINNVTIAVLKITANIVLMSIFNAFSIILDSDSIGYNSTIYISYSVIRSN